MPHNFGELTENVEIMRTGTHKSASGTPVTFTEDDLAAIADSYDPAFHEAPVVIGHPADNGPAYGWVKSLRSVGGRLLATLDLVPEFVEAVRLGLFKKRSASIYNDLDGKGRYLRHVGFLGAMPPAVKALSDINLADGKESATFEFSDKERAMSWKEKVKGLFVQAVDEIPEAGASAPVIITHHPTAEASFSEAQVAERVKAAADAAANAAREEAKAEFAEEMRKTREAEAALTHGAILKSRIDALINQGKVLPAWVKSGLIEFASSLAFKDSSQLEFSEAEKKTPSQWFMDFLESMPAQVHLGEVAGLGKDVSGGRASERLTAIAKGKMEKNPGLSFAHAFAEAQGEHRDLAILAISEDRS